MKLKEFKNIDNYVFYLVFENGVHGEVDLKEMISQYVTPQETSSAFLNKEWGCLEFNDHMVDIEPKTLYAFFLKNKIIDKQMAS